MKTLACAVIGVGLIFSVSLVEAEAPSRKTTARAVTKRRVVKKARATSKAPAASKASRKTTYKSTQHMSFEDEIIATGRATGNGEIIFADKKKRRNVMKLTRDNFLPELLKSADTF